MIARERRNCFISGRSTESSISMLQRHRHADLDLEAVEGLQVLLLIGQQGGAARQQLLLDSLDLQRADDVAFQQPAVAQQNVAEHVDVFLVDVDLDVLQHRVQVAGRRRRDGRRQSQRCRACWAARWRRRGWSWPWG